ncbi:YlbF family regulator [Bacillaceae bacterium W0354]
MSNIYDLAYDLEKGLRESDEFKELKTAYENVMNNPSTKKMFDDFRETQLNLQQKQMQGEEITEEEVAQAKRVVDLVQQQEDIAKLMNEEQRLNTLISDISRIITKPIEELYGQE